jgi:hypothetical protein
MEWKSEINKPDLSKKKKHKVKLETQFPIM